MFFTKKSKKIQWTPEAENLIKKVPPFIVNFVRKSAEREAQKRGHYQVTEELLQELAKRRSPHKSGEKFKLEDYFAKKTKNPMVGTFSEDSLTNDHTSKLGIGIPENSYESTWKTAAKQLDHDSPKALYIHIPFCTTRCKYCGFFVNGSVPGVLETYGEYVVRELDMIRNTPGISDKQFNIVYFGGGTPSDLSVNSLTEILKAVNKFNLSTDCEITLEGRVSSLSPEKIAVCQKYGVNRYSLGVQSFNTTLRRSMGRLSSREEIIPVLQRLHDNENNTVVIDQIYGLPGQTMDIWEEDIKTLFTECPISGVDHYPLILMPGTLLEDEISSGKISALPNAADRADMFCRSLEIMEKHGAKRISLKHFALDSRERNLYNCLQAYGGNCIPAGCGGGGAVNGYFFYQGGTLENYYEKLDDQEKPLTQIAPVTQEDRLMNQLSGAIQNDFSFSLDEIQQASKWTEFDLKECLFPLLQQYEECGLLSTEATGKIILTKAGQFWNNAIYQNLQTLFRNVRNKQKAAK